MRKYYHQPSTYDPSDYKPYKSNLISRLQTMGFHPVQAHELVKQVVSKGMTRDQLNRLVDYAQGNKERFQAVLLQVLREAK